MSEEQVSASTQVVALYRFVRLDDFESAFGDVEELEREFAQYIARLRVR